ncbi:protein of unknown function [Ruminococcaceae bacterium BL-4]|nr:protein of unknown function [Ruminococcaceae bacterium BL-4]
MKIEMKKSQYRKNTYWNFTTGQESKIIKEFRKKEKPESLIGF